MCTVATVSLRRVTRSDLHTLHWRGFFAERGRKDMRAALPNYRSKDVDRPHEMPRTKDFESLVRERKEFFPSFEADKTFLKD